MEIKGFRYRIIEESVSDNVVKIIPSYTGVINKNVRILSEFDFR